MGNQGKKYLRKIWLMTLVLEIVIWLIFYLFGLKICLFNIGSNVIVLGLLMLTLILPMIFFDYVDRTFIKVLYNLAVVILIPIIIFGYIMMYSGCRYFTFKSPNKTNTLVIEEKTFLLSGRSDVYEKKHGIFMEQIDTSISTDDGFRPFSSGSYKLEWNDENTVTINYDFGVGEVYKEEVISFK